MANTQARIGLHAETLLSASSSPEDALEGTDVSGLITGSTCYVDENEQVYTYDSADTNVADSPRLIKPAVGDGSWIMSSSGADGQATPETVIEVRSVADLPAPVAAVITLEDDRRYVFVGVVDVGVNQVVCGDNNRIYGRDGGQLFTDNAGAALVGSPGNFVMEDMVVFNSTGIGFVWSATAGALLRLSRCLFDGGGSTNGMTLTSAGAGTDVELHQVDSSGGSSGASLHFAGAFGSVMINDSKFFTALGDGIIFLTGATADACALNGSIVNAGAVGKSGIDVVDAAAVTEGRINGCIFEGTGTLLGVSGNIPGAGPEWFGRGNVGFVDF